MKYGPNGEPLITKIDRISKPGRRLYRGYKDLKPILGGMGIQILSTPGASSATAGPRREGRRRSPGDDPLIPRRDAGESAAPAVPSITNRQKNADGSTPRRIILPGA